MRHPKRVLGLLASTALLSTLMAAPIAASAVEANPERTVVNPTEYKGAIKNPMSGLVAKDFYVNVGADGKSPEDQPLDYQPWATQMLTFIPWDHLENDESDSVDKIRDYLDERWGGRDANGVWHSYEEYNIKTIPLVFLRFPTSTSGNNSDFFGFAGDHWPDDLSNGDFTSAAFDARLERMIQRLAEVWDDDPRVSYIKMGIFGTWGEQHGTAQPPNIEKYFKQYFQNKHVQVRYFDKGQWEDPNAFGQYNDSWGDLRTAPNWATKPIGGEPAYDYNGVNVHGNPLVRDTYLDPQYLNNTTNGIRSTHAVYLHWLSDYVYGSRWTGPDAVGGREAYLANKTVIDKGAEQVQRELGYRYVMNDFTYTTQVEPGGQFDVSFTVTNDGSAPMYYNWPVQVSLRDPDTNEIVWADTFDNVDIREWQPGSGYPAFNNQKAGSWSSQIHEYTTAPVPTAETGTFTLPADLPQKDYAVQLAVLDPGGNVPSLRFAMENYWEGGYHPMGYVGVGQAPTTTQIDPATFDSPAVDTTLRYYREGQQPETAATLDSIEISGTPKLLSQHGATYDLENLVINGTDANGGARVLDAVTADWNITAGSEHATLNGSLLKPGTAGTVTVTATFNGVTSNEYTFEISDNVGDISGTVTSDFGQAQSGATVTATSDSDTFTVLTGTNGSYLFDDVPAGTYTVKVAKSQFATKTVENVVVSKAAAVTVNVTVSLVTGGDFFDDFSAGAGKWTPGTGSWSVVDGKYQQNTVGGSNSWRYQSAVTGKIWQNATYEVDLQHTSGNNWGAILFRKTNQSDTVNNSGYFVAWNQSGKIELDRAGSTITTLATAQRTTDWSQAHRLKVVNRGSNIKVYLDNESTPVIDVNDSTFKYGYSSLGANGARWTFDNFRITEDPALLSIATPAAITDLENGTAKTAAALGLPSTVAIETSEGPGTADVAWEVAGSSYDPAVKAAQTFTVTGTVALPSSVENPNGVPLSVSASVTVEASALAVDVTTSSRCVSSKAVLTVTAVNNSTVPVNITIKTAYGTKAFTGVAPGKSAFHAFTTRLGTLPAGTANIDAAAAIDGQTVSTEQAVAYPARTC